MTGKNSGMNERLESLFEMTGCDNRCVTDKDFSVLDVPYSIEANFAMKRESERIILKMLEKNDYRQDNK